MLTPMTAEGYRVESAGSRQASRGWQAGEGWQSGGRADRARTMAAARRHTLLVRKLRWMLPAAGFAMVALIAGVKLLATVPLEGVSISAVSIDEGKLVMENARVTGHRRGTRSYELLAERAIQDPRDTSIVNLEKLDGTMTEEEGWTRLTADFGVYYTELEKVDLRRNIVVTKHDGQVVRLHVAHVDLQKGEVVSEEPVAIDMLNGTLTADSMRLEQNGELMHFNGTVRLNFVPDQDKGDGPEQDRDQDGKRPPAGNREQGDMADARR